MPRESGEIGRWHDDGGAPVQRDWREWWTVFIYVRAKGLLKPLDAPSRPKGDQT